MNLNEQEFECVECANFIKFPRSRIFTSRSLLVVCIFFKFSGFHEIIAIESGRLRSRKRGAQATGATESWLYVVCVSKVFYLLRSWLYRSVELLNF